MERLSFQVSRDGDSTSTFAHAYLDGFYLATGHSACVSPANFNAEEGSKYALNACLPKAEDKLWELEGYALRKELDAGFNQLTPAQQALPEHEVRVFIEHNQLFAKSEKLQAFLETDTAMALPDEEKELLLNQLDFMTKYGLVLSQRIALFGQRAKETAAAEAPTLQ
jgi:hypothetical protein